eukprot:11958619-Heterocapsa_arctica.AAC.1
MAIDYLMPFASITYADTDCGPGCSDPHEVARRIQSAHVNRERVRSPCVMFADVSSTVNTGRFFIPKDPRGSPVTTFRRKELTDNTRPHGDARVPMVSLPHLHIKRVR